eukprot:TRINITY_DN86966_c0_g1_i1.p1 TRINITY_DN86966_c0_g1~~TRINITY_DN86966_c0_g1_i1.p1  ORF type:complete len:177 (-),score=14.97 TRINITY_DN86966_c0_g1_i1:327-857(-)
MFRCTMTIRRTFVRFSSGSTVVDPYVELGISREASKADIQAAYYKKVQLHHPDKGGSKEKMSRIVEAYQKLRTLKQPTQTHKKWTWGPIKQHWDDNTASSEDKTGTAYTRRHFYAGFENFNQDERHWSSWEQGKNEYVDPFSWKAKRMKAATRGSDVQRDQRVILGVGAADGSLPF